MHMENIQSKTEEENKKKNHMILNRQVKPAVKLQRNGSLILAVAESHEKSVTVVHQRDQDASYRREGSF